MQGVPGARGPLFAQRRVAGNAPEGQTRHCRTPLSTAGTVPTVPPTGRWGDGFDLVQDTQLSEA